MAIDEKFFDFQNCDLNRLSREDLAVVVSRALNCVHRRKVEMINDYRGCNKKGCCPLKASTNLGYVCMVKGNGEIIGYK